MRLLALGDSNTYGYDPRSYVGERYPVGVRWTTRLPHSWQVENWGQNGREIPSVGRFGLWGRELSTAGSWDVLTVMLGTNDLLLHPKRAPSKVTADMEQFLRFLKGLPALRDTALLLIAPPPLRRGAWVEEEELVASSRELAGDYESLARELEIPFACAGEWDVELCFDGVHFLPEGHAAFAAGLSARLWDLGFS